MDRSSLRLREMSTASALPSLTSFTLRSLHVFSVVRIVQSTAERKSMSMQLLSDEMRSDTIVIRQKKYNLKSGKL